MADPAPNRIGTIARTADPITEDPATLWHYYIQLTEIEQQAFKELKHDLAVRPIFHQKNRRIEAHIFVAFIAYCLHVTLKSLARGHAPGLTPRAVLDKFAALQMVDVHLPTTDGRPGAAAPHPANPRPPTALATAGPATARATRATHRTLTPRPGRVVVPTFALQQRRINHLRSSNPASCESRASSGRWSMACTSRRLEH